MTVGCGTGDFEIMAVNYSIPPWIAQPADPAAQYATGLGIGVRIGAEQAKQMFVQQQLLREQAKDEFTRQYETQKLNMDIDKITRKQRAMDGFKADVAAGMTGEQALMKWGPELGESMAEIVRAQNLNEQSQQMQEYRNRQLEETRVWREQQEQRWNTDRQSREETQQANRESREAVQEANRAAREAAQSENRNLRAQLAINKDEQLETLQSRLDGARLDLELAKEQGPGLFGQRKNKVAEAEKALKEAQEAIAQRRAELNTQLGVETPTQRAPQPTSPSKRFRWADGKLVPVE